MVLKHTLKHISKRPREVNIDALAQILRQLFEIATISVLAFWSSDSNPLSSPS